MRTPRKRRPDRKIRVYVDTRPGKEWETHHQVEKPGKIGDRIVQVEYGGGEIMRFNRQTGEMIGNPKVPNVRYRIDPQEVGEGRI